MDELASLQESAREIAHERPEQPSRFAKLFEHETSIGATCRLQFATAGGQSMSCWK
jgi:hypothetical protein